MKNAFSWTGAARLDVLDVILIEKLQRAGCVQLTIGIETGSQRLQEHIGKKLHLEKTYKIMASLEKHGIEPHVSFILDLPGEINVDRRETLEMAFRLAATQTCNIHLNTVLFLPGAPMFSERAHYRRSVSADTRDVLRVLLRDFPKSFYSLINADTTGKSPLEIAEHLTSFTIDPLSPLEIALHLKRFLSSCSTPGWISDLLNIERAIREARESHVKPIHPAKKISRIIRGSRIDVAEFLQCAREGHNFSEAIRSQSIYYAIVIGPDRSDLIPISRILAVTLRFSKTQTSSLKMLLTLTTIQVYRERCFPSFREMRNAWSLAIL